MQVVLIMIKDPMKKFSIVAMGAIHSKSLKHLTKTFERCSRKTMHMSLLLLLVVLVKFFSGRSSSVSMLSLSELLVDKANDLLKLRFEVESSAEQA